MFSVPSTFRKRRLHSQKPGLTSQKVWNDKAPSLLCTSLNFAATCIHWNGDVCIYVYAIFWIGTTYIEQFDIYFKTYYTKCSSCRSNYSSSTVFVLLFANDISPFFTDIYLLVIAKRHKISVNWITRNFVIKATQFK